MGGTHGVRGPHKAIGGFEVLARYEPATVRLAGRLFADGTASFDAKARRVTRASASTALLPAYGPPSPLTGLARRGFFGRLVGRIVGRLVATPGTGDPLLTVSLYLLMFTSAVSCTMLGPLLPTIRAEYGLSLSQAGLMTTFQGVGGSLSVLVGILVADRLRRSATIGTTLAVYSTSAFLVVVLPFFPALVALFFLIGASTRLMDSFVNFYVSDLHREHRAFYLNLLHACFGLGALIGPSISALVIHRQLPWGRVFAGLAVLCLLALAFFALAERRAGTGHHGQPVAAAPRAGRGLGALLSGFAPLRNRVALLLCGLGLLYVGFANGLSVWIPSYAAERFHVSTFQASVPVSALWVGIITGRVTYSFLSRRFRVTGLLLASNAIAAGVMLLAIVIDTYLAVTLGLAFAGFFVGSTNPTAYALLGERFPEHAASLASALTFAGTVGLMTIPWLAGALAEQVGFWFGLLTLALCPCGMAVLSALLVASRSRRASAAGSAA